MVSCVYILILMGFFDQPSHQIYTDQSPQVIRNFYSLSFLLPSLMLNKHYSYYLLISDVACLLFRNWPSSTSSGSSTLYKGIRWILNGESLLDCLFFNCHIFVSHQMKCDQRKQKKLQFWLQYHQDHKIFTLIVTSLCSYQHNLSFMQCSILGCLSHLLKESFVDCTVLVK